MKKHKIWSIFQICTGLLLMIAAGALAAYNYWDDARAAAAADAVLQQITGISQSSDLQTTSGEPDAVPDYVFAPDMEMPAITIDGYRYIGTIMLPSLGVELPIMEEWDYTRMKIAPCRYSGSVYLNNLIICAHNYTAHFGRLDKLQENDEVIVTDVEGNIFQFEVVETETLDGTAVEEMTAGSWDLTLFTCTYSGTARVTIRCRIVK